MPFMQWPQASDVQDLLSSGGWESVPSSLDIDSVILGVVDEFENQTGWLPFLANSLDSDLKFDLQSTRLDLPVPCVEISQISSDGNVLVEGQDYWMSGLNGQIRWIRFAFVPVALPYSLVVTGRPGFGDEIPDRVWQAVLKESAARVWTSVITKADTNRIPNEVRQDTVMYKFDHSKSDDPRENWQREFADCVAEYRLKSLGVSSC